MSGRARDERWCLLNLQRGRPGEAQGRVLTDDGPHWLKLSSITGELTRVAVSASVAPDAPGGGIASYAAVINDGRAALGIITATDLTRIGALMVALRHALPMCQGSSAPRIRIDQKELRWILADGRLIYSHQPYMRSHRLLPYPEVTDEVRRHLRRTKAVVEELDLPRRYRTRSTVPRQDPIAAAGFRLSWFTLRLARDRVPIDRDVLAQLAPAAEAGATIEQLRARYRQLFPQTRPEQQLNGEN